MARKRPARELTVIASQQLTKNMLRLTLQGEDLASFPTDAEGSYFKLAFASDNPDKPIMRTYTVAKFRADKHEMDVDFMLHGSHDDEIDGIAASWAQQATMGDKISIFGPGNATFINTSADWFLLAADMTALPALTANLKRLPTSAQGYVVVEILCQEDKQNLPVPANMEVLWVVNPTAGSDASPLADVIRNLTWLDGQLATWIACEFKTMKSIRQYVCKEMSVEKPHLYISSYWKKGLMEEEHKIAKSEDMA